MAKVVSVHRTNIARPSAQTNHRGPISQFPNFNRPINQPIYNQPIYNQAYPIYPQYPQYPQYAQPSFYGTCAAAGSTIVSNNCLGGTLATPVSGNGCTCVDLSTGWSGCGDTANGVCRLPIAQPILSPGSIVIQQPLI